MILVKDLFICFNNNLFLILNFIGVYFMQFPSIDPQSKPSNYSKDDKLEVRSGVNVKNVAEAINKSLKPQDLETEKSVVRTVKKSKTEKTEVRITERKSVAPSDESESRSVEAKKQMFQKMINEKNKASQERKSVKVSKEGISKLKQSSEDLNKGVKQRNAPISSHPSVLKEEQQQEDHSTNYSGIPSKQLFEERMSTRQVEEGMKEQMEEQNPSETLYSGIPSKQLFQERMAQNFPGTVLPIQEKENMDVHTVSSNVIPSEEKVDSNQNSIELTSELKRVFEKKLHLKRARSVHEKGVPLEKAVFHFQTGLKEKQIQQAIGEDHYQELLKDIRTSGLFYYQQAVTNRTKVEAKFEQHSVIFTPSGKVYLKSDLLGTGKFKETHSKYLVANINPHSAEIALKSNDKAFGATTNVNDINQMLYEGIVDLHIMNLAKENPQNFSLILVPTSVSYLNNGLIGITSDKLDGNLNKFFENQGRLSPEETFWIAALLAQAVEQLHDAEIVHRDLKLDNFMYKLNSEGQIETIKLGDFGLSLLLDPKEPQYTHAEIPLVHMDTRVYEVGSAEAKRKILAEPASDMYQLAISLLQLFSSESLQELKSSKKEYENRLMSQNAVSDYAHATELWKRNFSNWPEMISLKKSHPRVYKMLIQMTQENGAKRPTAKELREFFYQELTRILS